MLPARFEMRAEVVPSAYSRHRRIVALRNRMVQTFLELGEELYWFENNQDYEQLGYVSFNAYLADPDVDISRSTAYKLKGIYQRFVLELASPAAGLLEAGTDKLELIRPYVTEDNVSEMICKASSLSRSDLRIELNGHEPVPKPWNDDAEWRALMAVLSDYYANGTDEERLALVAGWLEEANEDHK